MRKPQNFQWREMTMGVCYYPEHWLQTMWEQDLDRMLDAGITVIRIAEFAWNYEDQTNPILACVKDCIIYLEPGIYSVSYETTVNLAEKEL